MVVRCCGYYAAHHHTSPAERKSVWKAVLCYAVLAIVSVADVWRGRGTQAQPLHTCILVRLQAGLPTLSRDSTPMCAPTPPHRTKMAEQ